LQKQNTVAQQIFNITPQNLPAFKTGLYTYANSFATCLCLDNNQNKNACGYSSYDMVVGMGAKATLKLDNQNGAFEQLKQFHALHNGWLLGYLGYDLKNGVEKLTSNNADGLGFAPLYFFVPQIVVLVTPNSIEIIADDPALVYQTIQNTKPEADKTTPNVQFIPRVNRQAYIDKVEKVRQHIAEGDVYELNLCMEFYAKNVEIAPLQTHLQLLKISPVPFAAYGKFGNGHYAMCASPERFIKKQGDKLISQPIKGTAKRGQNPADDEALKYNLRNSEKEMAENVMIVDLVRNDLARSALAGSVKVEELFGIYSFQQVHQMISTVTAQLKPGKHWADALAKTFPMGSMTGAPKVMAMQLIEQYEESKRGLFSGAMGYITPDGDFDFNVVIRSLLYNAQNKYLSYHVGGAITYDSVAQEEFDECMVKALAINSLWGGKI
jgi:para-aminobenzoate synthetase component I